MEALEQLRARRDEIARLKAALDKEDQDLSIAERVFLKLSGVTVQEDNSLGARLVRGNKALVVRVLEDQPQPWMSAEQIRLEIKRTQGHMIGKTTLFPLLTAMKNEGLIVRNGGVVALARRVEGENV